MVLLDALAAVVRGAEVELRVLVALLGRLGVPVHGAREVLLDAAPLGVCYAEVELHDRVARGSLFERRGAIIVITAARAARVAVALVLVLLVVVLGGGGGGGICVATIAATAGNVVRRRRGCATAPRGPRTLACSLELLQPRDLLSCRGQRGVHVVLV